MAEYPDETASIIAYMSTVMSLTGRGLGSAWWDYDEAFRKARETDPPAYRWDTPPPRIWMESVAQGLSASPVGTGQGSFPARSGAGLSRLPSTATASTPSGMLTEGL